MKRIVCLGIFSLFLSVHTNAFAQSNTTYLPPINLPVKEVGNKNKSFNNQKVFNTHVKDDLSVSKPVPAPMSSTSNLPFINTPEDNLKSQASNMSKEEMDKLSHIKLPKPYIDDNLITIGTGSLTGVYYPAGGAICRMMNRRRDETGVRCAVESSSGSIYNLAALRNAEVDFAIVQSDWQEYAFDGTNIFEKQGPFEKLRYVFSLYDEALTLIVRSDANINKLDDIQGKIINIGPKGSGARATMEMLMAIKNWSAKNFKGIAELSSEQQIQALCDRKIDVMVALVGHPSGVIQDATSMCDTKILNLNDPQVKDFVAKNYDYAMTTIPGGLYVGEPDDITTFGLKALLLTTTDTSTEMVYQLTKSVFDNLDNFRKLNPVFSGLNIKDMMNEGRIIPIHPGAMKYYEEKGYFK